MSYEFRPPIPSAGAHVTKAAAIAIAGESGSGKTESAMRLARGYCGPGEKFVVIDTEEKRALYKKSRHQPWDWLDFQPPFTPERTWAVLDSVKHYKAVIIDSMSHEYAGEGGISEEADDNLERMSKGDPAKAEKLVALAWKNPKMRHKRELMSHLIRYPTLLICCLRAEPKVKFAKVEKEGRMVNAIVDMGSQPICEKRFMFEMLASFMMYSENAGVPTQVKALEEDLKPIFLLDQRIDEATGARLSAWANGGEAFKPLVVTAEQVATLRAKCKAAKVEEAVICTRAEVERLEDVPSELYASAAKWLDRKASSDTGKVHATGGPEPITDEAQALVRIERSRDAGEASAILDLCREQPFYERAAKAVRAQFP